MNGEREQHDTKAKIDAAWATKPGLTNWPEMEKVQRAILREYKNGRFTAAQCAFWLDEALAAYTRRGNEL